MALSEAGIETFLLQFQPLKEELQRFAGEIMPRVRELQNRRAYELDMGNSSGYYDSAE